MSEKGSRISDINKCGMITESVFRKRPHCVEYCPTSESRRIVVRHRTRRDGYTPPRTFLGHLAIQSFFLLRIGGMRTKSVFHFKNKRDIPQGGREVLRRRVGLIATSWNMVCRKEIAFQKHYFVTYICSYGTRKSPFIRDLDFNKQSSFAALF